MTKTKLGLALVATAALVACQSKPSESIISGTAPESLEGKYIYLYEAPTSRNEEPVKLDSALVDKGAFAFAPRAVDEVSLYALQGADGSDVMLPLTLEVGQIVVDLNAEGEKAEPFKQGKINQAYIAFQREMTESMKAVREQIEGLDKEAADYEDTLQGIITKYGEDMRKKYSDVLDANKNNIIGANALLGLLGDTELTQEGFVALKARAGADVLKQARVEKTIASLEAKFTTVAGQKFVDFTGTTPTGEEVKLSQYVGQGHYTLVDFWASWCGPCRRSMPDLIKINEQYGAKGLSILGLFVWDKPENLETAVKELGITWPQIVNYDDATTAYGVQGIPHMMLIAPDGTIVARDIHGYDEISALLETEMAKNGGAL